MKSFGKLNDQQTINTKFVLKGINPSQLDKKYIINEIQEIGIQELSQELTNPSTSSDTLTKLTSTLEMLGVSKTKAKPFETIVVNDDIDVRLFITPGCFSLNDKKQQSTAAIFDRYIEDYKQENKHVQHYFNMTVLRKCHCWYCRYPLHFDWYPIGIPVKYKKEANAFEVEGVFCSFNCIVAYLNEHYDYRYKDSSILLLMMYRKLFGYDRKLTSIIPAPSWKLLKDYGGHLSIEEYRKCLQHIEYKSLQQHFAKNEIKLSHNSEVFCEVVMNSA